jgi:FkbM family methyltransferase
MSLAVAARSVAWVTRTFHGLPGRWRLVRWLDQHADTLASLPPATVRFAGRYRMRVNPVDENGRRVYVNGFEPDERLTRHFIRLVRPGDCVIDVGANVGYYTMVSATLAGPQGSVHAFEASPHTLPWLKTNAALNPVMNIEVHGEAVTDACGRTQFFTATEDKTGYSSIRDLGQEAASVAEVETVSLDSMLDRLPPVRLVKIDVEGAEMLVLKGMRGLIERDHPFFITEIDDCFLRELGHSAAEQCSFLTERGYALFRIVERGDLVPLGEPPVDRCNLLACPNTPEGLAAARVRG